jgi:hypothetical protein
VTAPAFESVDEERIEAAETLVRAADATVVAGPLDGPTERLAATAESAFAIEGACDGSVGPTVTEGELLEALDTGEPIEPVRSPSR